MDLTSVAGHDASLGGIVGTTLVAVPAWLSESGAGSEKNLLNLGSFRAMATIGRGEGATIGIGESAASMMHVSKDAETSWDRQS